jgi:flagellar basal body L-ring protein FlgH
MGRFQLPLVYVLTLLAVAIIAAAAGEVVQRNEPSPLKDTNLLQQPPQPKPQQKKRKSQLSLD